MDFPVNYQIHELPVLGFTLENLYVALTENLSGTIDEVVLPAAGDDQVSSFAPSFSGDSWKVWDDNLKAYVPALTQVGNVTLSASPTANRLQMVQDKAGVVALLDDAYGIRSTVILREGLVSVDWDKGNNFRLTLGANRQSAIYMTHSKPGMEIDLLVVNSGTNQTVVWDPAIQWQAATASQPPAAAPGMAKGVLVTLRNIGGIIFAEGINYTALNQVTDLGTPTGLISV